MNDWLKDQLINLIQSKAISYGDFQLASGSRSTYYIDFSKVSLSHLGSVVIATKVAEACRNFNFSAIGGPVLGACPIVTASVVRLPGVRGFYIRREEKGHAKKDLIEGPIKEGDNVVIVEDVTTSGASVLRAANIARDIYHCKVLKILTMVDRQAGAEELLAKNGYDFESFVRLEELGIGED
jgi:orotate phosphoribosyltransferase